MATKDEVEDFFLKRGASEKCPICGHEKWGGLGFNGNHVISLPVLLEGDKSTHEASKQFLTITLVCMNCYFMRMHSMEFIEKALSKGDDSDDKK